MILLLSQIVRKYLSIHLISTGTVFNDSRTKLDPKNVDSIVYLKTNIEKMNQTFCSLKMETEAEKSEQESNTKKITKPT